MAAPRHPLGTDRAPTEPLASTSKAPLQDLERGSTVPDERGSADDRGSDKPWEEGKLPGEALARQASRSSRRAGKARDLESGAGDSSDDSDDEEQQDHAGLSPLARCAPTTTTAPTRPPLAKLGSSTSTTTAFTLPSLPSTPDGDPPTPHGLRIDDGNGLASSSKPVLFVLPPSLSSSHAHSHPTITTTSHPSGTTTTEGLGSWKSRSRKGPTIEKKRLAALGFEEELSRDYDFWASAGLTLCNIGGFPGESAELPISASKRLVRSCMLMYHRTRRYRSRRPYRLPHGRRINVRHRLAYLWPLHALPRCRPRRDGQYVASRR